MEDYKTLEKMLEDAKDLRELGRQQQKEMAAAKKIAEDKARAEEIQRNKAKAEAARARKKEETRKMRLLLERQKREEEERLEKERLTEKAKRLEQSKKDKELARARRDFLERSEPLEESSAAAAAKPKSKLQKKGKKVDSDSDVFKDFKITDTERFNAVTAIAREMAQAAERKKRREEILRARQVAPDEVGGEPSTKVKESESRRVVALEVFELESAEGDDETPSPRAVYGASGRAMKEGAISRTAFC